RRGRLELTVDLSQPVPWRVFTLTDPDRVVLDFSELDWTGADPDALASSTARISAMAVGVYRPGWSRMVIELAEPMAVAEAEMITGDGRARLTLRLNDSDRARFEAAAGAPESALFRPTDGAALPARARPRGQGPLVVVIDPGHGGIDPGAEREGEREADLMLTFARELKEALLRGGNIEVTLTRDDDVFVPLETRVTIARRAGADVFLSFHADALAEGRAHGATVYTLSEEASDVASAKLAERHDRADLLAGVDLSQADDAVALVLMDLARTETAPRSEALAVALVEGIYSATQSTYKTPRMQAAFSVLKAPDIPSALIELGFLSSPRDRKNLTDPDWRRQAALGIRDALLYWAIEDAATAERLRR
ncbi:MAG: N-acetylmuramoyl-L-alanine amidase, partial [Rhodobacterales bacterium CG2_30_65_12]